MCFGGTDREKRERMVGVKRITSLQTGLEGHGNTGASAASTKRVPGHRSRFPRNIVGVWSNPTAAAWMLKKPVLFPWTLL